MRKSRQQRIGDTLATIEAFEAAGLTGDYRVNFMCDMVVRLNRNRNLSTKQRNWLDSLCTSGPPSPKGDPALLASIDSALEILASDARCVEPLQSFRSRLVGGRDLSEKQTKFLESLLAKAEDIRVNGYYRPDEATLADLRIAHAVCEARAGWIGTNKPGTYKAFEKVRAWLAREPTAAAIPNNIILDEWSVNKVLNEGRVALREAHNPNHPSGSMRWAHVPATNEIVPVIVMDGPFFEDRPPKRFVGKALYECLVDGNLVTYQGDQLGKRRPRKR